MYQRLMQLGLHSTESALILGPRGTGKTHWLKNTYPNALYFDLLHHETYLDFAANPSRLEARIPSDYTGIIIIDEIQKIPALLNEVHRLIEHHARQFIVTGSSARSLRRKGVNLLAGRALTFHMHPLTVDEMSNHFDLPKALQYGLLPSVWHSSRPALYLKSYVNTYLKEEVQQEALTRNIPLFTRFLVAASFSQGEILNYTEIGREIGSNRQTVMNFFEILEDLLLATRLPVFTRRAKREVVAQPKFYYFDTGVFKILRPKGPLDSESEINGAGLETLFLQHARAYNDYDALGYDFYYWRTRSQHEVDFVLYGERGFYAIEIKSKKTLSEKDLKGLHLFKQDYPTATGIVLYGGERSYCDQDIMVIPFPLGLRKLRAWLSGSEAVLPNL